MESLGIEIKLLLGQIINFVLLLILLVFFLYRPIVKMLNDRREKIADSLTKAKEIDEKLAATEAHSKEILDKTQKEASRIINESNKLAQAQKNEILDNAKKQSDKILLGAQTEATAMKDKVVAEAKKDLGELVVAALDKIANELTPEEKKRLSDKAIEGIGD